MAEREISIPEKGLKDRQNNVLSVLSFFATLLVVMCHVDDFLPCREGVEGMIVRYLGGAFSDANVANFFVLSGYFLARHVGEKSWYVDALR